MSPVRQFIRLGSLKVDTHLLERRSVARCHLAECRAACCGHGVLVDMADASRIVQEAELVKPHLPLGRRDVDAWFDGNVVADTDFPSGYRVGTEVVDDPHHAAGTRCVFLCHDNRCALQVAAVAQNRHRWDLKPFYCALFPIVVSGDEVQLDDENQIYALGGTCERADTSPVPVYSVFQEELVLALGQEGYDQLCSITSAQAGVDR